MMKILLGESLISIMMETSVQDATPLLVPDSLVIHETVAEHRFLKQVD